MFLLPLLLNVSQLFAIMVRCSSPGIHLCAPSPVIQPLCSAGVCATLPAHSMYGYGGLPILLFQPSFYCPLCTSPNKGHCPKRCICFIPILLLFASLFKLRPIQSNKGKNSSPGKSPFSANCGLSYIARIGMVSRSSSVRHQGPLRQRRGPGQPPRLPMLNTSPHTGRL